MANGREQITVRQRGAVRPLTARHLELLELLASGLSQREAADSLGVSLYTVKTYADRMYLRLGVRSLEEALRTAALRGELPTTVGASPLLAQTA